MDTFTGTAKDDTFLATTAANWSVGDSIDGGKGFDTLKLIDNGGLVGYTLTIPVAASIKNIEAIDIIGNAAVTADSTSIDGVTHLYTTSTGANTSTAAATTNINATATGAAVAAEAIAVNGGKDVTVVSKNNALDTITVGGTTAAAGKVSVTSTGGTANGNLQGNIAVTGGTEITVNQYAGNAAAIGNNTIGGTVTVTGNASTTTVTVNQTANATAVAAVPAAGAARQGHDDDHALCRVPETQGDRGEGGQAPRRQRQEAKRQRRRPRHARRDGRREGAGRLHEGVRGKAWLIVCPNNCKCWC